jgi:phospholipase C
MRRTFLAAAATAAVTTLAFSCSEELPKPLSTDTADAAVDMRPPTPPEWDRAVTRESEAQAASDRAACKFKRGDLADESLGAEVPVGKDIPIDTIVVIVQENRSFDQYFGHFGKYAGRTDVEAAPETTTNPEDVTDAGSPTHPWQHGPHLCAADTDHSWKGSHLEYDDGKNDGFFQANHAPAKGEDGERALWWYDERDIPYYYAVAKEFGIADHYHCSLLGPTWPNRMYVVAGTSFGYADNGTFPSLDAYPFPANDIMLFDELEKRHVDWKFFTGGGPPGATVVAGLTVGTRWNRDVVDSIEDFEQLAQAGTLPSVAFVDADFTKESDPAAEDEHPPADVQVGQRFVARVISALTKSPQWKRSALFVTYDENGGLYDHVPPPAACPPDDKPPVDRNGRALTGAFDRYGFRVPLLVVSPYTKKGYVSHVTYDHTSVLRFIQARFRVPALTSRDANAAIPLDFFDFANPPNLVPPALPEPTVDDAELGYCKSTF